MYIYTYDFVHSELTIDVFANDCLRHVCCQHRIHPGSVIQEEISTIMRYLGAYPTEKAMVKEILPDMQVYERGYIT